MTSAPQSSLPFLLFVTSLGVYFAATGCDGPGICALQRVYGVRVTVVGGAEMPPSHGTEGGAGGAGGASGASEAGAGGEGNVATKCLATVTATDGQYTEQLKCSVDEADCVCLGLTELPGDFLIRVELGGRDETQTVRVRPEGCGVTTKQVTFFDE